MGQRSQHGGELIHDGTPRSVGASGQRRERRRDPGVAPTGFWRGSVLGETYRLPRQSPASNTAQRRTGGRIRHSRPRSGLRPARENITRRAATRQPPSERLSGCFRGSFSARRTRPIFRGAIIATGHSANRGRTPVPSPRRTLIIGAKDNPAPATEKTRSALVARPRPGPVPAAKRRPQPEQRPWPRGRRP